MSARRIFRHVSSTGAVHGHLSKVCLRVLGSCRIDSEPGGAPVDARTEDDDIRFIPEPSPASALIFLRRASRTRSSRATWCSRSSATTARSAMGTFTSSMQSSATWMACVRALPDLQAGQDRLLPRRLSGMPPDKRRPAVHAGPGRPGYTVHGRRQPGGGRPGPGGGAKSAWPTRVPRACDFTPPARQASAATCSRPPATASTARRWPPSCS